MKWQDIKRCDNQCRYWEKCPIGWKPLELYMGNHVVFRCHHLLDLKEVMFEIRIREKEKLDLMMEGKK